MLSVCKTDSINIFLYTLPILFPCCVPQLNLQAQQPMKSLWSRPHTPCACFSCLHVPFPVATCPLPPRPGLDSSLPSANLPWVLSAIHVWIDKSFPGETACRQSLKKHCRKFEKERPFLKPARSLPGVFALEGALNHIYSWTVSPKSPLRFHVAERVYHILLLA